MPTFHILTQYIWPDAAPTGLYAEHLAVRLHECDCDVRLIGGTGNYRALGREKPPLPLLHLEHFCGRRVSLAETFLEYSSVKRAFATYIDNFVRRDDIVIVTSAPPNTVQLAARIKRRGAQAIYWLQDYYPELVRGIHEYPAPLRRAFCAYWDAQLSQWDRVVKIGTNLGSPSHNAVVIRNWPTISFDHITAPEPKTALYSGNLGYGHNVDLFVRACEQLRDGGYRLTIRCDGRGMSKLPAWLNVQPLHSDPEKLKADLLRHEVHLIAANPKITRAIFPSKIWNSLALGRRVICTGFDREMASELDAARASDFTQHLEQWVELLTSFATRPHLAVVAPSMQLQPNLTPAAVA